MLFWGREKPNARAPQHRQTRASWEGYRRNRRDWFNQPRDLSYQLKKKPANMLSRLRAQTNFFVQIIFFLNIFSCMMKITAFRHLIIKK